MAADRVVIDAMIEAGWTRDEAKTALGVALEAWTQQQTEVTFTNATMGGGTAGAELIGDPREVMETCKALIDRIDALAAGEEKMNDSSSANFGARYIET